MNEDKWMNLLKYIELVVLSASSIRLPYKLRHGARGHSSSTVTTLLYDIVYLSC